MFERKVFRRTDAVAEPPRLSLIALPLLKLASSIVIVPVVVTSIPGLLGSAVLPRPKTSTNCNVTFPVEPLPTMLCPLPLRRIRPAAVPTTE